MYGKRFRRHSGKRFGRRSRRWSREIMCFFVFLILSSSFKRCQILSNSFKLFHMFSSSFKLFYLFQKLRAAGQEQEGRSRRAGVLQSFSFVKRFIHGFSKLTLWGSHRFQILALFQSLQNTCLFLGSTWLRIIILNSLKFCQHLSFFQQFSFFKKVIKRLIQGVPFAGPTPEPPSSSDRDLQKFYTPHPSTKSENRGRRIRCCI